MLFWTHLIVGLFGVLLYLPWAENKMVFMVVALIASIFPDIDSGNSKIGRKGISKVIAAFATHRGFFHSLLFVVFGYLLLWNIWEIAAFPFLFGYLIHLFLDCFTVRGIRLFYPLKFKFRFFIKSGGMFEAFLFVVFFVLDIFLIIARIML